MIYHHHPLLSLKPTWPWQRGSRRGRSHAPRWAPSPGQLGDPWDGGSGWWIKNELMVHLIYLIYIYTYIEFVGFIDGYTIWWSLSTVNTSSTAQGGGGSFKNRKLIGEVGCCESGMAERSRWWTERCLRSPLFRSLSLTIYLPTYLSIFYVSIYLSISLSFI